TLQKLRDRIEGRRPRAVDAADGQDPAATMASNADPTASEAEAAWTGRRRGEKAPLGDESLVAAKQQLAEAVESMLDVLRAPHVGTTIGVVDRANLAKYLTIAKLRLENAIALVRSEGS